jgi:HupE / UreJ protein
MEDFVFYFKIGWQHIINKEALDHIFFIIALSAIYMLKDWRQVLVLVTAFTVGHTVTLVLSTLQLVVVPSGWVEFLIPCTIVGTAVSNLFQKTFTHRAIRINYFLALFFGLIHGLAFANTLRMILSSDQNFALSMFSFSVGLELGQILIVFCILLLAQLFIGFLHVNRREWVLFVSAVVFGLAMEMAVQRFPGHTSERRSEAKFDKIMTLNCRFGNKSFLL